MRVSVIIPALDEGLALPRLACFAGAVREAGGEVIVVDGGSRDGTPEIAARLGARVITEQSGRARQMTAGARVAQGEVLWFVHADTLPPTSAIAYLLSLQLPVWGHFAVRIRGESRGLRMVAAGINLRSRISDVATGDQAIFVSRDLFVAVGGFPAQPLMEDVQLCKGLRRLARGWRPPMPVETSGRRWDKHGLWRTIWLMWRLRFDYWRGIDTHILFRQYYGREP
jgi:rSAM/selenodomain-associated transferase 2